MKGHETGDVVAGRYRIVRVLGRGGVGTTYEAEDEQGTASPSSSCACGTARLEDARALPTRGAHAPWRTTRLTIYTVPNTRVVSIAEHFKSFGAIHHKLKGIPDGTRVSIKLDAS